MFAKPWESQDNSAISEAIETTAHKPWDPVVPKVAPRVIEGHSSRMMARGDGRTIDKIKAQAFAKAYLVDFDGFNALVRIGEADETTDRVVISRKAGDYLRNPIVLQTLQAFISRVESDKLVSRERILMGLLEEACYHGPGSSASARVAAWGKLAKLMGMELPPEDLDAKARARGGVMLVPFAGGIEEWERAAIGQQAQLKADVRT